MYSFVKYDGTRTHDLLIAGALPTELHTHFRITRNFVLFRANNLVSTN